MNTERSFRANLIFALARLSPLIAPAAMVPVMPAEPAQVVGLFKAWLALLATIVTWNMSEGAAMLWMRAKQHGDAKARSYLIVTMICGAIAIAFLQYLRGLTSQWLFITILTTISIRGMSRTGWENNRLTAGFIAAILGHTILTLATFLLITATLDWQSLVCAVSIGSAIGAIEASWYAHNAKASELHFILPLFRICLCIGPVIITTMSMAKQLPHSYLLTVLVVGFSSRIIRSTRQTGTIPAPLLAGAAGIYITFLTIMSGCRIYEYGLSH